jgi:nucleoside-diphosphate-sugar epimerase
MTKSSDLHVVFGTGPLGRSVMAELARRGKRVRMVNRSGRLPGAPAGVEVAAGNAYEPAEVQRLTQGAQVVYQCAQPKYTEWPAKFLPLQAAILEGVAASGARLVIGENLYMYGDTDGRPIAENLPYAAHGPKGRTRAQMAEAALAAHRAGKVRVAIGRGSDFFGPGVLASAAGELVFGAVVKGRSAQVMGKPDLPHTYTYIEDFGRALVTLGERDEALGRAWHVPNAATVSTRRFLQMAAQAAGQPLKVLAAGPLLLTAIGLFNAEVREFWEMRYEFEKPFVVDSSQFERAFGLKATPLEEAVERTVRWFQAEQPQTSMQPRPA